MAPSSPDQPARCYLRAVCAGKCSASLLGFEQQQETPTRGIGNPTPPDAGRYILNQYGERLCQISGSFDQDITLGQGQLLTWHMDRIQGTINDIVKRAKLHPKLKRGQKFGKRMESTIEDDQMAEAEKEKKGIEDELNGVSVWIDEVRVGAGWVLVCESEGEEVERNQENDCGPQDYDE